MGVTTLLAFSFSKPRSTSTTGSPALIRCPSVAILLKPSPFSSTVSMPKWTNSSTARGGFHTESMIGFKNLANHTITGRDHNMPGWINGQTILHTTLSANTGSGTSSMGTILPVKGAFRTVPSFEPKPRLFLKRVKDSHNCYLRLLQQSSVKLAHGMRSLHRCGTGEYRLGGKQKASCSEAFPT